MKSQTDYDGFVIKRNGQRTVVQDRTQYYSILPSEMLSVDEIIDDLYYGLSSSELQKIKQETEDNLIMYHSTFGRFIRNTFCLWLTGNPNVVLNDLGDGHPDGVSMTIIRKLHERVQVHAAYDRSMSDKT